MWVYDNITQAQLAYNFSNTALSENNFEIARELNTPGVNIFAMPMTVNPGLQTTTQLSLAIEGVHCSAQLGYTYFCRSAECISHSCCFAQQSAFKSNAADAASRFGTTDDVQTISSFFDNLNQKDFAHYGQNIITRDELDFSSAAHPRMAQHTVYGELGCRDDRYCYPLFATLGASYTFAPDNAGMASWLLWANLGFSF